MKAGLGQVKSTAKPSQANSTGQFPCRVGYFTVLLAVTLLLPTGCSRLHLPAIDPNGSSIFLPFPNTTQLDLPRLRSTETEPGFIPIPAYTTPPTPPPCVDGLCNGFGSKHQLWNRLQSHFDSPGKAGEIQMTPMRVVAPVGGEVVLLGGICGPDGYLVKRAPLEWMLSPDSVGTFIDVGDDHPGRLASLLHMRGPKVEKLDVDFARGRTSSKETLITRGSPECNDDIRLREGQTWLSISSPTEGVSRVTLLAPDSEIWDRRRLTAVIYWVDASMVFPPPQIQRSGETVQLITRVTQSENLVPAEDWIVEYTILDPNVATFDPPTGSNKAVVRVNRDGQAIVNLVTPPGGRGTTPVAIDVIRPADPSDNLPDIRLQRGHTTVTFSSPGLNLEAFGPQVGAVGEQLTYMVSLGNPGDVDAENVSLVLYKPAGTRILGFSPEPTTRTDAALRWDQGVLAANRQLDVSVILESVQEGTFDVVFEAQGEGGLTASSSVRTEILTASVNTRFEPTNGIAQAELGETIEYEIDVENTGRQTLTDLRLRVETDAGLPEAVGGQNVVERVIPVLQPGESTPVGITFRVQQEGQLAARLQVLSGDQVLSEKTTSIRGLPARQKQPDIGVTVEFPDTVQVGRSERAVITVRNPGEVKLTDIQVELLFDRSLRAKAVDVNNRTRFQLGADEQSATWSAQDLLPRASDSDGGFVRQIVIEFDILAPASQGAIQVRASAAEGVQADGSTAFQAITSEVTPPVTPPVRPPANAPRSGALELSLVDYGDPTLVDNELRYILTLTNSQNLPDRNIHVLIRVPQGVEFRRITNDDGLNVAYQYTGANTITLEDVQFMRSGETINFTLVVVPKIPQLMELRAQTFSDAHPDPVEASETTTVNPRN